MSDDPKKLARTLLYLVEKGYVPGLLPDDVLRAAAVLLEQESELETLRAAQAAKTHTVSVKVMDDDPWRKTIRGTFIIADPRIYYGEIMTDAMIMERGGDDLRRHQSRHLARVATADWMRDIEEATYAAVRKAFAPQFEKEPK